MKKNKKKKKKKEKKKKNKKKTLTVTENGKIIVRILRFIQKKFGSF
jgi:hypothetical protein